jgi:hypothetical protein
MDPEQDPNIEFNEEFAQAFFWWLAQRNLERRANRGVVLLLLKRPDDDNYMIVANAEEALESFAMMN